MLISTSAWSFQREEVFLVSKAILVATSCSAEGAVSVHSPRPAEPGSQASGP